MILLRLIRALGLGVTAGMVSNLLYLAGKKISANRPPDEAGETRRKYVESCVIDTKTGTSGEKDS